MTQFVLLALALCLLAVLIVAGPLWRDGQRAILIPLLIVVPGLGLGGYFLTSNFAFDQPTTAPSVDDMMARLDRRLIENPDDLDGWRMLGRSNMQLERFVEAASAYEKAYTLSGGSDPTIILDYAEALVASDPVALTGSAGQLVENALKLTPAHPRALWYGGLVAAARNEPELAADRWESMLSPDMPADIREILEVRIAALRGEPAHGAAPAAAVESVPTEIVAHVDIAEALESEVGRGAILYLIAKAPGGGPPLAVVRHPAAEIPDEVTIGDGDAMIAGRTLSSQQSLLLTARISQTGEPLARPGDIFGEIELQLPAEKPVTLTINQRVTGE